MREVNILSKYIYWHEDLEIRNIKDIIILSIKRKDIYEAVNTEKNNITYKINDTASEIIQLVDGTRTYDEIIYYLSKKYKEDHNNIEKKIKVFLKNISQAYNLKIEFQDIAKKRSINIINQISIYPTAASVELLNTCNIRCLHCYGSFGNIESKIMSLDKAKKLLKELRDIGVGVIELTGGEIGIHPNIKEIISYAIDLKFNQISLLTNGIALSDEVMDLIIKNKSRIFIQIDLHSLDDNYLTWFTKVPNTLEIIKENIEKLAKNDVKLRVATIITRRNIDELEDIAEWVNSLGIGSFGVSPVVQLGRAVDSDKDLFLDDIDIVTKLESTLQKINKKYENLLSIIDGDHDKKINCGCVTSHVVINSSGDIKICTMDTLKYFNSKLGNVFESNIKNIYDENSEYINELFKLKSPKFESEECSKCDNINFCRGCLLRGFIKASEMKEKCSWYSNVIPESIKEKLII